MLHLPSMRHNTIKPFFDSGFMIETEKCTIDFLRQVTEDGQRCRVEFNNGDILETSSLCSIHRTQDGQVYGVSLDASGTFRGNENAPFDFSSFAAQEITLPLKSIKSIMLLPTESGGHSIPSLDKATI